MCKGFHVHNFPSLPKMYIPSLLTTAGRGSPDILTSDPSTGRHHRCTENHSMLSSTLLYIVRQKLHNHTKNITCRVGPMVQGFQREGENQPCSSTLVFLTCLYTLEILERRSKSTSGMAGVANPSAPPTVASSKLRNPSKLFNYSG